MRKVLKITFIFIFLLLIGTCSVKAANVDVVTQTINPAKTYSTLQVRYLQKELNFIIGSQMDTIGVLGPQTKAAIRTFQQSYGLTVDGIVGPATRGKLNELYQADRVLVYGNPVNVRDKAGFSSNVIGQVHKGDTLIYYDSKKVDGETWFKIDYNGRQAYIVGYLARKNFIDIDITSQSIYRHRIIVRYTNNNRKIRWR